MKLTFLEHQEIGRALKLINHRVCVQDYKFMNKKEANNSHQIKARTLNMELKSHMEDIMFRDYPKQADRHIYYGELEEDQIAFEELEK